MPNSIAISEVAAGFRYAMTETFESVFGIYLDTGTSLFETLAGISAAQASQPMGGCASIAAHVAHMRYYLEVLEDRLLRRDLSSVDWARVWQEVGAVDEAQWQALLTDLRAQYQRALRQLDEADTWEGTHELSCMLAIIAHSAYHLGEIRQMLCHLER